METLDNNNKSRKPDSGKILPINKNDKGDEHSRDQNADSPKNKLRFSLGKNYDFLVETNRSKYPIIIIFLYLLTCLLKSHFFKIIIFFYILYLLGVPTDIILEFIQAITFREDLQNTAN